MDRLGFNKGMHYTKHVEKAKALSTLAIFTKQINSFLGLRMLLGKDPELKVAVPSLVL